MGELAKVGVRAKMKKVAFTITFYLEFPDFVFAVFETTI
jgi:hypothetical protein